MIDAHHHLWDLGAVNYPWLMAQGVRRFFGDPTPIQRNYLLDEFASEAGAQGVSASVHIQVGAESGWAEAQWVQATADQNPHWPMAQVVFCDLTAPDVDVQLDRFQTLPTVRGVRQIVGRAPDEDAQTGTNALLDDPRFADGLRNAAQRGLSFDLQLIPELMGQMADVLEHVPDLKVALCHAGSPHDRSAAGLAAWSDSLRALSSLPNVWCKLSGLGMFEHDWTKDSIRPIVETCIAQFGPDRIMFGSNFPVDKLYSSYQTVTNAYRALVPEEMAERFFHANAVRFYGFAE